MNNSDITILITVVIIIVIIILLNTNSIIDKKNNIENFENSGLPKITNKTVANNQNRNFSLNLLKYIFPKISQESQESQKLQKINIEQETIQSLQSVKQIQNNTNNTNDINDLNDTNIVSAEDKTAQVFLPNSSNIETQKDNILNNPISLCTNTSLNNTNKNAYSYLIDIEKIPDKKFLMCNKYDEQNNDNDDITDIYRKSQVFIKTYMEDPVLRGNNLDEYEHYSPLFKTGYISLGKEFDNPKPNNFVFQSSAIFNR